MHAWHRSSIIWLISNLMGSIIRAARRSPLRPRTSRPDYSTFAPTSRLAAIHRRIRRLASHHVVSAGDATDKCPIWFVMLYILYVGSTLYERSVYFVRIRWQPNSCLGHAQDDVHWYGSIDFLHYYWVPIKLLRIFACVGELKGHENRVTSISMAPNGMALASCSWDTTVRVWV